MFSIHNIPWEEVCGLILKFDRCFATVTYYFTRHDRIRVIMNLEYEWFNLTHIWLGEDVKLQCF